MSWRPYDDWPEEDVVDMLEFHRDELPLLYNWLNLTHAGGRDADIETLRVTLARFALAFPMLLQEVRALLADADDAQAARIAEVIDRQACLAALETIAKIHGIPGIFHGVLGAPVQEPPVAPAPEAVPRSQDVSHVRGQATAQGRRPPCAPQQPSEPGDAAFVCNPLYMLLREAAGQRRGCQHDVLTQPLLGQRRS